jgi:hypothetical protein
VLGRMRKHLAIFNKEAIAQILLGKKTIESRFSKKRISPFGEVGVGDLVYIKEAGGEIRGQFIVEKVIFIEGLKEKDWEEIIDKFWDKISLGDIQKDQEFIKIHKTSQFATLIYIGNIEQFLVSPFKIEKKDKRGWVVLD